MNGLANVENADSNLNNIWSHILQDVQNSTKKTPPPKSIILLGDNESGRTTLISRLKGVESICKGVGLEYHYIDVKDEDRDDTPKLGVWVPDGDGTCNGLLKFALNETNIEHTLIIFVVSMGAPWTIMDSLKKWSNLISEHLKKLNIDEKKLNFYREQIRINYENYQEPDETILQQLNSNNNNNKKEPLNLLSQKKIINSNINSDSLIPLDASVLTNNLGLSTIVVVTKSDSISMLDKETEYRVEHFDYIQYVVRKFCLNYGSALFYTSMKDKRTYDKLYKYILHKFYNYPFNYASCVVDRESIFVPSGWDNESKINILLENNTSIRVDGEFTDVIQKPNIRKPLQRDVETVISVEDQDFLSKLQIQLNKVSTPVPKQEEITTPSGTPNTTNANKPAHKTTPIKSNSQAPDSTNLKSFFQNLLAKNSPNNAPNPNATNLSSTPTTQSPNNNDQTNTPVTHLRKNSNNNDYNETENTQLTTDAIASS